jgi:flagellar operon protein
MADNLVILPQPLQPVSPSEAPGKKQGKGTASVSFDQVLTDRLRSTEKIKFSKHAESRMASRGIELNQDELERLDRAVKLADEKGARDSLVMINNTALVVSVKNNTVVTVVDKDNVTGNVFTNIDSAVIA